VSELVANAVQHGGDGEHPVCLEVRAAEDVLRVAVMDAGPGFSPQRLASPSLDRAGGWGLPLVASLAGRWGVDSGDPREPAVLLTSPWPDSV
jgi:anti-sigma regulatory factor (Ser/Thr protein kinase)